MTPNPYFRLYTTQLGMNITDLWKAFKRHHREGGIIPLSTVFVYIMAYKMIKEEKILKTTEDDVPDRVRAVDIAPSKESTTSSLSCPILSHGKYTMVLLEGKKQVQIWWSRVNLV